MFYDWHGVKELNGIDDSIDLSAYLSYFLQTKTLSADIAFRTDSPRYMTLFAIYYKESLFPDFSLSLHKGLVVLAAKRKGALRIIKSSRAYNDGAAHLMSFRGGENGNRVCVDGREVILDPEEGPYCDFGYVGFATAGRGTLEDSYADYFKGALTLLRFSQHLEALPPVQSKEGMQSVVVLKKGMLGAENFRIPALVALRDGTLVLTADARMDAPGDNPNHIARAVRVSRDGGAVWDAPYLALDYGGTGRQDGAAALDASLLYEESTETVFMLFSHTSSGIGSASSEPGTGFDASGRKILRRRDGADCFVLTDGRIADKDGLDTGYLLKTPGRITDRDGRDFGSVCHGENRLFKQADTSFLQLMVSRDKGRSWSEPRDLNPGVKAEWMRFIGAGPGTGICLREPPHKGRLVYPIYYSTANGCTYSCGAIYSDDHGATWTRGASVNDGRVFRGTTLSAQSADVREAGLGECQIAELPDGRLMIFIRAEGVRKVCTALSPDGGETWSDFSVRPDMDNPGCQAHVLRLTASKGYLFSGPAHPSLRVRGMVSSAPDTPESWRSSFCAEPGEFGYSCMAQLTDDTACIVYEGAELSIRFLHFPLLRA